MATQMIHARIEQNLKKEAEKIFSSLGINTSDAIRMFFTQVTLRHGLPFEMRIPNRETQKAMEDSRLNRNLTRVSVEELDELFND